MATSAKHETRALLRAHLSAASGYRHLTRHCPVCHRLLRLALEQPGQPDTASARSGVGLARGTEAEPASGAERAARQTPKGDESPSER
ncbi:DUF6274 family protein [Streptomyces buecherae]|uniref:Uncharacterized protein n=1 Tax=Streptomyces buecherae TaxID=2763006 RepID=A0A7H8NCG9_9ACTN|nr:DUF6274 family protein [Streptomyces buecherae]QKW51468.1 hypothetical protein HUT08_20160 [Streptomyces buecherae]